MCLERLQNISLYLAKSLEKPSRGFDEQPKDPKNTNTTKEKALRRPYWIRRITLKMAKYVLRGFIGLQNEVKISLTKKIFKLHCVVGKNFLKKN